MLAYVLFWLLTTTSFTWAQSHSHIYLCVPLVPEPKPIFPLLSPMVCHWSTLYYCHRPLCRCSTCHMRSSAVSRSTDYLGNLRRAQKDFDVWWVYLDPSFIDFHDFHILHRSPNCLLAPTVAWNTLIDLVVGPAPSISHLLSHSQPHLHHY